MEVSNPIDWTHIRRVLTSQERYRTTEEFKMLFGGYNDTLPNMRQVDADKFWGKFGQYGVGEYQGYRQITYESGKRAPKMVHYFIYSDGTGLAVEVKWHYGEEIVWQPTFYSFALCEHERKSTLDTNRGWHEGYCTKCGMTMNYDSSD